MRQRLLAILTEILPAYNANRILDRQLDAMAEPTQAQIDAAAGQSLVLRGVSADAWRKMVEAIR